jgi:hypothetical protein
LPTEHDLSRSVRRHLDELRERGEPIRGWKIHGDQFQRDVPDWFIVYHGFAVVIELKPPTGSRKVTPGQAVQLHNAQRAGAATWVCRSMDEVKHALSMVADYARNQYSVVEDDHGALPTPWQQMQGRTIPEWLES